MGYILIVEDERHVAHLIERVLTNYKTHTYDDGLMALKYLTITDRVPDLLILDVNLPSMNGFDVAKALRQQSHPALADLPIMFLSAQNSRESQIEGLEYADDYLTKPFDPDILQARVGALLRRRQRQSSQIIKRKVDNLAGETILQYKVEKLLGRGGMGVVYKAHDNRLDRKVALKFITTGFEDAEHQARFIREAQAASHLESPHICTVYTVEESEEGFLFMVMPFLEGETLDSYLKQHQGCPTMSLMHVQSLMLQLCRGLHSAHSEGIVHRDIKPSNVFLEQSGRVRILDFGVAKWKHRDGMRSLVPNNSQNVFMGTLAYMSPEQALNNQISPLSDIWSIGVMLYEILTGHNPFNQQQGFADLIGMILHQDPAPLPEKVAIFQPIVDQLLRKQPEERYSNVRAVEEEISVLPLLQ